MGKQDLEIRRNIASAFFINVQTGWILAGDEIYCTKDGGKKWEKSDLPVKFERTGNLPGGGKFMNMTGEKLDEDWSKGDIYFIDDKSGWAVVGKWFIFHTEDGGKTWTDQLMSPMSYGLGHLFFTDSTRGCATGSSVLCTEDGKTWTERLGVKSRDSAVIDGFSISPHGISFSGQYGFAVGDDGLIMKSEDGGKKWKVLSRKNECGYIPFFVNEKTGWLYFPTPAYTHICRTDDGGLTWTRQEVGMGEIHLFFVNEAVGWAVGQEEEDIKKREGESFEEMATRRFNAKKYMVIRHTIDGGKSWITQFREPLTIKDEHGFRFGLMDIFLSDINTGWAVGGNGLILHTTNAGKRWMRHKVERN